MNRILSYPVGVLLACCLLYSPAVAFQIQTVADFVDLHPGVHFYGTPLTEHMGPADEASTFSAIYGTTIGVGATPEDSAWNHIGRIRPLLGDDWGVLVPEVKPDGEVLVPVMSGTGGGDTPGFYTFRFNQQFDGLPVFRSGVGFLVRNEPGNPVVVSGIDIKKLPGFSAGAGGTPEVSKAMLAHVETLMDQGSDPALKSVLNKERLPIVVSDEEVVIFAGVNGQAADPEVSVKFIATRGSVQTAPDYKKYLIVASLGTSDILLAESQIHFDVSGTVSGRATSGLGALECHPEVAVGMPYVEVFIDNSNGAYADASGNFTVPHGGTGPVTMRTRLRGQWFVVYDQATQTIPEVELTGVNPPGPANFLHNPNDEEFPTANVNAYLEANVVRDYVLDKQPNYPIIANQQGFDIYTNLNDACNAFYDGSSINFYLAAGGCYNTSMSDVVYHEYGHHLIAVTSNGQAALGEGSGDVMGLLLQDEPILAHGFQQNCSAGIRNADNLLQFPCSGNSHFCGQLLSGAVWDTRHELAITEPSSFRDLNATLFLGMLMVRGQMVPGSGAVDPFITILYLEVDDDDADINNGTPHYNEIANGFGLHNLNAPELVLVDYVFPTGRPELIPESGGVMFHVEIQPISQSPQPGSAVMYVDRGNGFESFPMNEVSPNVYEANFPTAPCSQVVSYYFSSETTGGNTQFDPPGAPYLLYTALVGSTVVTGFSDDFETDNGWFEIGDATEGWWERGVPGGSGERGDPLTDADGSGQCFITGNTYINEDVDGGYTRLVSPLIPAVGQPGEVALLTYRRWYSNNTGMDPENDILHVEITGDSGANWTTLEIVGPSGGEVAGGWIEKTFRLNDFVTPSPNIRVTFNCSDYNEGSIVEAGLDAVAVKFVSCAPIGPVVTEGRKLLDGLTTAGSMADTSASDDVHWSLDPSPTANPLKQRVDMLLLATSPVVTPSSLGFRLEARMTGGPAGDVIQTVQLLNYQTGDFEVVDVRPAPNSDTMIESTIVGDPTRFVQPGSREVTAQITWLSDSFAGTPFNWSVDLDEAVWLIN